MIGCGSVTECKSAPAYQCAEGSMLVAVAARRFEAAQEYAQRHSIEKVFDDPAALIHSPEVDAVYIATPPDSHLRYALQVAAAGKPCCVEKPIAMSFDEAATMVAAFEHARQSLFVAYYRRSLPRFDTVREWLRKGAIGSVRHVNWTLTRTPKALDGSGGGGWRIQPVSAPRGYFDDLACHGLDLLDDLLGPVAEMSGFSTNQNGLYDVPDAFAASWLHDDGITGTGTWNFASPFRRDHVLIAGELGEIEFSVFDDHEVRLKTAEHVQAVIVDNPDPIQLPHVSNIIASLRNGSPHPSTGESAMRTAWVMDRLAKGSQRNSGATER
jgi:1,5-anhydro-D-fructose reductase (1,5-anhydro-D-mannitol-forming)